ncbi:hypothetical protein A2Y26_03590 [candidate division CPR2 bacterium GWD2_39_7]|nr:MAG: hypothetical protein A2Y27_03395 [candidate division CPR2 bacterium GWD1_39_7]OGB73166.1 MAG: hypothetical protein A2Y26_03590 [candidate division CPR2 bacterium GWD2_39_7]
MLTLISAFLFAVLNILDKFGLERWVKHPMVQALFFGFLGLITAGFIFIFKDTSSISLGRALLAIFVGVFAFLSGYLYLKAAMVEEISRVVPVLRLDSFMVLVLSSIFLNEIFTSRRYVGIFFLIIGPFIIYSENLRKIRLTKGFWLTFFSVVAVGFQYVLNKYLLRFADFWTVFAYNRIGVFLVIIPLLLIYKKDIKSNFKETGKALTPFLIFSQTLAIGAVFLHTSAISKGYVSLVSVLSSAQLLFVIGITTVLSIFFPKILKENTSKKIVLKKTTAAVLMLVGVYLIS